MCRRVSIKEGENYENVKLQTNTQTNKLQILTREQTKKKTNIFIVDCGIVTLEERNKKRLEQT